MDLLEEVGEQQFPSVLEALKKNWPKHFLAFQMFKILEEFTKANCRFESKLYLYGDVETGVYLQKITVPASESPMHNFYLYTPSQDLEAVEKILQGTYRIPWTKKPYLLFENIPSTLRPLFERTFVANGIRALTNPTYLFIFPDETDIVLPIVPNDVRLEFLKEVHYTEVDQNWPNRYPGSDILHKEFITKNFGLGLFSKDDDKLLSFGVCNHTGGIFNLFTKAEFRGKGYATVIILHMTEEIRKRGMLPFCTINTNNTPSLNAFTKLGFVKFDAVDYFKIHSYSTSNDHC